MVPSNPQNVNRLSKTNACRDRTDTQHGPNPNHVPVGRMAYLRERYRDQQVSEDATALLLGSWRTKYMTRCLGNGIAGVLNGIMIPFQDL